MFEGEAASQKFVEWLDFRLAYFVFSSFYVGHITYISRARVNKLVSTVL